MILNPISLLMAIVLEACIAWWRIDKSRQRRARRVVVVDRRQPRASITVYSMRKRR